MVGAQMTITRIADESDPRLDVYTRLSDRQLRSLADPSQAMVVCESLLVIKVAVERGLELQSVLVDERHLDNLLQTVPALASMDVPVYTATREQLQGVTGINVHRGYFAAARRPRPRGLGEVLDGASRIAVLEGLVDITNVGALFRSAAALGVDGIVLAPRCADPLNRRSVRVSMGTVFVLPWAVAPEPWPQSLLGELGERGFHTVALALDDRAVPIDDPSLAGHGRLALFFGSEGWGLSDQVLGGVDSTAIIPMQRGVDSLNVAASSAVAFWELCSRGRS